LLQASLFTNTQAVWNAVGHWAAAVQKFGTHVGWSSLTICSSSQTPLNISLPCFLTVAKVVAKGSSKKGGMSFHLAWTRSEGYCAVIGANMFRLKSADRKMKNIGVFLSVLRPA
jgi:hypothetical protein